MRRVLIVVVVSILAVVGASEAESRGFSADDLVRMERISGPQASPDGKWVVFMKRHTDMEADRGRTDLWLVGVDGTGLRQLTKNPAGDSNPVWSPDSESLFFLSSRSGSSQVWHLPVADGEAIQVTDLPLDVGNLLLSPQGDQIAFTLDVFPDCRTLKCTVQRLEARDDDSISGRLYDQIFVRHWDTWGDGRRSHLFVMPATGGDWRDLTPGEEADVPSKPFGGAEEMVFTPDGQGLVFTMRDVGATEPWSTDFDLYHVPTDGSASPRCLTESNEAWDTQPVFAPDGKTMAYLAMARPGFEADRFRIVLMSWPEGTSRVLTEGWDYSSSGVLFSSDSQILYTTAGDRGQVSLFAIDRDSGEVATLVGEGHVRSPTLAGDRIVFGLDTLGSPVDLYSVAKAGGALERLTRVNDDRLAGIAMGRAEQFAFEGWNEETVHAYVVEPANFDEGQKYPVAFLIHGGPQGSFGNDFHYRWNPQIYAGAGYGAVMVDFHGSTGYGQDFTDSISGDWGGKPLEDLQKGLAAALERYPWLDGDRVCALGASYGGYMINWIAGNWPDGFRCLINHDGVFDNRMMYYATEELWFPEWEHGGPYWANPEGHEKHNPVNHVSEWRTPMLVVHGELDYRIPVTQALAAFTALQRQGVPSQFLYFPDENHWVLRPANSVLWHETVLEWMGRWVENSEE